MYIEPNRLNQLNKNLFGHGILQTKKLKPDLGRIVMPDPSLPKIKRYNIKSNNPLNYLLSANANVQPQSQIQPQPQQLIPIQNSEEIQDIQQPQENINQQEELYSQKNSEKQNQEINEEPVPQPQPEPEVMAPTNKKYAITDLGENIVDLPPNYSTDDELEFKVLNLLNEPRQNYKLACENERVQVYKKKGENDIQILKTYGKVPYPLEQVKEVMLDTPGMDDWDKTFKKHEIIQQFPEENGMLREINYLYVKMPIFMTDRDLVQEAKIWKAYNGNPKGSLRFLGTYLAL